MRTTICLMILALSFSILSVVPNVRAAADGAARCSDSTLQGSYGLHATGTTPAGPIALVGVLSYDGAGGITGTLFVRRTGSTTTEISSVTGTYTVNPDCTVSDTLGNAPHTSVIVDGGRGYFILNTTEGAPIVISGEARKQFPGLGNK